VTADSGIGGSSYNALMTSITTETTTHRPSERSFRRPILGFVAGLALATSAAVGVNFATSDGPSSSSKVTPASASVPSAASPDAQCRTHRGPC
jgi:hypothetical protein